ncbi:MAG: isomerizing glutamine--fructose-6-phosphate transaminase, partial [Dehalococcoidia bacterium]|nr:isomerizing glutamine--fructose-6-phosphate transaminase [Dehalococcoidia bacterium]
LEYRGYDSAGVAAVSESSLKIHKNVGCISEVNQGHCLENLDGHVAIGHTRWATHGRASRVNAHPHTDTSGRVAVVHNGIVENYVQLRNELRRTGVFFRSETDSEVIPHLVAKELAEGAVSLEVAVRRVCGQLKGSYAFVVVSADAPGVMIGVRWRNPLVVGFGADGHYLSSDVVAFASWAESMTSLQNGEMVVLTAESARFLDAKGGEVCKKVCAVDCLWADADKCGCPHFMLKEIQEEPKALSLTGQLDAGLLREIALKIAGAHHVVITACGTSRHASLVGRYLFSRMAHRMSEVVMASEFGYFSDSVDQDTVVIAVSQSGETADVLHGVELAKKAGATIVSIVNRSSCLLAEE